jgi:hypothetical protein
MLVCVFSHGFCVLQNCIYIVYSVWFNNTHLFNKKAWEYNIAAEGSLLFLTICYSAFEFPANSFIRALEAYLDFCVFVGSLTSYYDVAVRNLHWNIIIPQEFTIANRWLPNTLFSDLRTTFQEWRLKIFRSAALWVCGIYKHEARSEAKTFFV